MLSFADLGQLLQASASMLDISGQAFAAAEGLFGMQESA